MAEAVNHHDNTIKSQNLFSKILSRREARNSEKRKSKKDEKKSMEEITSIKDIPIVTGMPVEGTSDSSQRRIGLSEKTESDRVIVKNILKEVIKSENLAAI